MLRKVANYLDRFLCQTKFETLSTSKENLPKIKKVNIRSLHFETGMDSKKIKLQNVRFIEASYDLLHDLCLFLKFRI